MNLSLQSIAAALGGEVCGGEVRAPGPGHTPIDRSLCVKLAPGTPDGFVVHSFASDDWQTCKDHTKERLGFKWEPERKLSAPQVARKDQSKIVAEYIYCDPDGQPSRKVLRTEPKGPFPQQRWDGARWINGVKGVPLYPYRLPELLKAVHNTVFVCEGEKDADRLTQLGFVATTNPMGAGCWHADLNHWFKGRTCYILEDNDDAGRKHAREVAEALQPIAESVRIVSLPGLPDKGDVSDWLDAGGDHGKLIEICKAAPLCGEVLPPARLIVSSGEFVANFVPPEYLIDGLLQRRFCYSFTAPTGAGKTAIMLLWAASIADSRRIGEYEVEPGPVLYLAGENPDDVRMRWIAMADILGFDINTIPVHFLPGAFKISEIAERIRQEVEIIGPVSAVMVDTSAAYFEGDNENDNVQAGAHARRMRGLVSLPGGPCIIVACHPVKNAGNDNLLPRGGGAFIAEVDGNLTCQKSESAVTLHWQGKFRGPDFAPVTFGLSTVTNPKLVDSKGRNIPTVVAKAMSEREQVMAEATTRDDDNALLIALFEAASPQSNAALAAQLGWTMKGDKPNKMKVKRAADRLRGLIKQERGGLILTDKGKAEVKRVQYNRDAAGATYG